MGALAITHRATAAPPDREPHAWPLFLTDRKAPARTPTLDVCPITHKARLSYRRAAELFEEATRPLADPVHRAHGFTLHQLRHSALTHESEDGTSTPMLLARSRHASVRSLERYALAGVAVTTRKEPQMAVVKVDHVRALCAGSRGRTALVLTPDGPRIVTPQAALDGVLDGTYLDLLCTRSDLLDDGLRPDRDGHLQGPVIDVCARIAKHLNETLDAA